MKRLQKENKRAHICFASFPTGSAQLSKGGEHSRLHPASRQASSPPQLTPPPAALSTQASASPTSDLSCPFSGLECSSDLLTHLTAVPPSLLPSGTYSHSFFPCLPQMLTTARKGNYDVPFYRMPPFGFLDVSSEAGCMFPPKNTV